MLDIKNAALSSSVLKCHDNVHDGDGITLGVVSVLRSAAENFAEPINESLSRFFIDRSSNALDASPTSQTADGGLGQSKYVVTVDLPPFRIDVHEMHALASPLRDDARCIGEVGRSELVHLL